MRLPIPDSDGHGEFGLDDAGTPVRECDAKGECASCRKKRLAKMAEKGPEIHSAKAHRCVDKVGAKGHDESSSWAICTASMGKSKVYAKGHGGKASPKRKVAEAEMDDLVESLCQETWSDAARAGALCARTHKPEHCSLAKSAAKDAVKSTVKSAVKNTKQAVRNAAKTLDDITSGRHDRNLDAEQTLADQRKEAEEYRNTIIARRKESIDIDKREEQARKTLGLKWYQSLPKDHPISVEKRKREDKAREEITEDWEKDSPRDRTGKLKKDYQKKLTLQMAAFLGKG